MWCQWVKSYQVKGKSFQEVKIPSNSPWEWRKILNLRTIVLPHIKVAISNGKFTSLWYDNWSTLDPLATRYRPRIIYEFGLAKDFIVFDIIRGNNWVFPITHTIELNEVRNSLYSIPAPNQSLGDQHLQTLNTSGKFKISSLWNHLRTKFPKVPGCKCVWFPRHIPKCSFISWIAIQHRLYTEDKLVLFGNKSVSSCSYY